MLAAQKFSGWLLGFGVSSVTTSYMTSKAPVTAMEQQLTVSISERKHPVLAWFWISGSKLKQSALNIVPFGSESGCYHKYLL